MPALSLQPRTVHRAMVKVFQLMEDAMVAAAQAFLAVAKMGVCYSL